MHRDVEAALLGSIVSVDQAPKFRGLLYGDSGVGKTVLAMQMAQKLISGAGKILFIDSAEGYATLQVNDRWRPLTTNCDRMQYKGVAQLSALAEAIKEKHPSFTDYKVIILDQSSSMSDQDLVTVSRARTIADPLRDEPNENTWPDRNISYNRFREAINNLSVGIHTIHLAHTGSQKDKATNIEFTKPSYGPSLYESICDPMHLVGYVTANIVDGTYLRQVQVSPTRTVVAKTRIDGLKPKLSFEEVIEAVSRFATGTLSQSTFSPSVGIKV